MHWPIAIFHKFQALSPGYVTVQDQLKLLMIFAPLLNMNLIMVHKVQQPVCGKLEIDLVAKEWLPASRRMAHTPLPHGL